MQQELRSPTQRTLVGTRELLRALVLKELKVKYKRSILGLFWSLLTPMALTGIYLFVFVHVYRIPKPDFVLLLLTGLLPWNYFNMSLLATTGAFIENGPLVRKVYFPRQLLPISIIVSNLINFLAGLLFLVVILMFSGRAIWTQLHWVVIALALETALLIGISLFASIGNVYFRDIQQLISILILVLFFGTPIVYELADVPATFRNFLLVNPMTSVIEIYRAALFRVEGPDMSLVLLAFGETALMLVLGVLIFRKFAPNLAKEV
ncbi:MAG: ABC transporter permease [Actinomycetota bacterium]